MAPCLLVTKSSPPLGGRAQKRALSPVRLSLKVALFLLLLCTGVFLSADGYLQWCTAFVWTSQETDVTFAQSSTIVLFEEDHHNLIRRLL